MNDDDRCLKVSQSDESGAQEYLNVVTLAEMVGDNVRFVTRGFGGAVTVTPLHFVDQPLAVFRKRRVGEERSASREIVELAESNPFAGCQFPSLGKGWICALQNGRAIEDSGSVEGTVSVDDVGGDSGSWDGSPHPSSVVVPPDSGHLISRCEPVSKLQVIQMQLGSKLHLLKWPKDPEAKKVTENSNIPTVELGFLFCISCVRFRGLIRYFAFILCESTRW